jgi:hypothetical protein
VTFYLDDWYCRESASVFLKGTYWANKVIAKPTVGFTTLEEALQEAHRLDRQLTKKSGIHRVNTVKTIQYHNGQELGIVHELLNGSTTFHNLPGETSMAKFTLSTIPTDVDKFWTLITNAGGGANIGPSHPAWDVEQEARDEAAKQFSASQGQRKVWLMESVAIIDPVVPKVTWREDIKTKPAAA